MYTLGNARNVFNEKKSMNDEQRKILKESAAQMPIEAVRQMETVLRRFFDESGTPYNVDTLNAALQMCLLIHPNLPPVYGEFVGSSILLILRLIEEAETGLVGSPIKV